MLLLFSLTHYLWCKLFYSKHLLSLVHPCDRKDKAFCDQVCNKNETSFECSCRDGFKFGEDGKTCVEG